MSPFEAELHGCQHREALHREAEQARLAALAAPRRQTLRAHLAGLLYAVALRVDSGHTRRQPSIAR